MGNIEDFQHFLKTTRHTLFTKGVIATIEYIDTALVAALSYKEKNEPREGSKTGRLLNYAEEKLTILNDSITSRNDKIESAIKENIQNQIKQLPIECSDLQTIIIDQIKDAFKKAIYEELKDGTKEFIDKKKNIIQLNLDLKKVDSRVLRYIDKFTDLGIIFEDEERLAIDLSMVCKLDSKMEIRLQRRLLDVVKRKTTESGNAQ